MDVVVPFGPGSLWDLELLYSLRSLHAYVPNVERVFIVGARLWWMKDVHWHAAGDVSGAPNRSVLLKLRGFLNTTELSERFLLWNDDFFLTAPFEDVLHHRTGHNTSNDVHGQAYKATRAILGDKCERNYELHLPVTMNTSKVRDLLNDLVGMNVALRTLYFNTYPRPAELITDVKVGHWNRVPQGGCFSIADRVASDPRFREWVAKRYPEPSPWEWPDAVTRLR